MPTISANVSKKEFDAIREYANACGETMSNLIRKVMIKEATFMNGFSGSKEYECGILVPNNVTGEEDTKMTQGVYNNIRRILSMDEIEL